MHRSIIEERKLNLRNLKSVELLEVHAEGEVGQILTQGAPPIPGDTLLQQMQHINEIDDSILKFCLHEPRGKSQMTVNLLLPSKNPAAKYGFIPMQPDGAHSMSGSNSMCVATALIELGLVESSGPVCSVPIDTPSGLITANATIAGAKVTSVEIEMPKSFLEHSDLEIYVNGIGNVKVDVAFGGCYFVLVDIAQLQIEICNQNAEKLVSLGKAIKEAASKQITVQHPELNELNSIEYTMFVEKSLPQIKTSTILYPGRVDRSPCGTGTSAQLAALIAKGEVNSDQEITSESIIGGQFFANTKKHLKCGSRDAIVPTMRGRAWIYGKTEFLIDQSDPFLSGYTLSDTW